MRNNLLKEIENLKIFHYKSPFNLEAGGILPELHVGYHTYGKMNKDKTNVIWVCHALTANSNVADWWSGVFGEGRILDPKKYFIVCANVLCSNYGSTGPRSISPITQRSYGLDFPLVTVRDWIRAYDLLRLHLGINEISLCIGGSSGGHQVLEFSYLLQEKIKKIAILVCAAQETAWSIALHEAQRMCLETDPTFKKNTHKSGAQGMEAARGMALLGYRTFEQYVKSQTDEPNKIDNFKASSYIRYQGKKLEKRFFAQSYWYLLKALDTQNIGRNRGGTISALSKLTMPAFVLSIDSDILIPPSEQVFLAQHLPNSHYVTLHSPYGHDGFLIETEDINKEILGWFNKKPILL
jgi:homoserine O-acetyltransferase/O-succinyltransferase